MATRQMLAELVERYRRETGHRVSVTSIGGVEAARRVQAGEMFDFAVLASGAIDRLIEAGHLAADRTDIARSGMAVAVGNSAPRPDVSSSAALREAVLRAPRIGYSTGPSGDHLMKLIAGWGLTDELAPRLVQAPPGVPVGRLIAEGEVAIGFQQLTELINIPGVVVLGPLPADMQLITVFAAAVCTVSRRAEVARNFLSFLASEATCEVKHIFGMEPA
ncbi:substrate-binding domain-containing protein [Burkholderia multivorans]|nr:substrate-binding domain-containing protein [Burkholderia multivorans]MCO8353451.1 substrate-binding domain-containing protein [Burkholderia multivorans]MCO8385710.1 substrate-binding domain-containing protein [Burkholderia multivorans]MCO8406609.1 substrate-binding domain-containing protein [Burkholderia multivorans]MCO8434806.1 substrate-binding domain-containing protein [Burkholderia multivorans]